MLKYESFVDENFYLSIINYYPRPVAIAYDRSVKSSHPMEKFFAMIDTVEALVHCLATIVLWSYLEIEKKERNSEWDQIIFKALFNSTGVSFGTWKDISTETVTKYLPEGKIPDELKEFQRNKDISNILSNFVELRNFQIAHSYVRTASVFQMEIDRLLKDLCHLLNVCTFLQNIEFLIPVQYEKNQLIKADKYIGTQIHKDVPLSPVIQIDESIKQFLKERQSFLAYFKITKKYIPLFPFYIQKSCFPEQNSGMYFLSKIEISSKSIGKPEIVSIKYRTYEEKLAKTQKTNKYNSKHNELELYMANYVLDLLNISYGIEIRSFIGGLDSSHSTCLSNISEKKEDSKIPLNLLEFFNGRNIKGAEEWKKICQRISNFFDNDVKNLPSPIPLYFYCHLSIAFYTGYILKPKQSNLGEIIPIQKTKSGIFEKWNFPKDWNILNSQNLWDIQNPKEIKNEIVIAVEVSRNIRKDLEIFFKESPIKEYFYFSLANKNNQMEGELAWIYARQLQQIFSEEIPPDQCKKIHLLLATPVAFAYILGQELHVTSEIQLYEYGYEERSGYIPSIYISHKTE